MPSCESIIFGNPACRTQLVDLGEAAVWHRASALGHLVGPTWSAELRASLLPRLRAPYEGLQALVPAMRGSGRSMIFRFSCFNGRRIFGFTQKSLPGLLGLFSNHQKTREV